MRTTRNNAPSDNSDSTPDTSGERLKVLMVGGSECLDRSTEVLDSLLTLGYGVNLLGVLDQGDELLLSATSHAEEESGFERFKRIMQSDPPDLLIITSDNHLLRKALMEIISSQTRVLDSFALNLFNAVKDLSGRLHTTQNRLESVQIIKEVLMAGAETSIMVVDEELKILDINNIVLEKTQMSREGCLNRPCHWAIKKLMEPCYQRGGSCVVREVLRTGRAAHTLQEEVRTGKPNRFFTISAYPLKEDERGKKSVMVVWKDITRGMANVLDRQARSIQENFSYYLQRDKMVALGKLAAAAVHEINNPVQGIMTFAKLMRASLDKDSLTAQEVEKFRTYLDMIAAESARCGKILTNLLSFSRRGDLKKIAVDIVSVIEEVHLMLGHRLDLANIIFELDVDENLPPIYGDRDQIKQGLLNLVLNAAEAIRESGSIKATARYEPDIGSIRLTISDTGPGIPKDIQASIFEPFFTTKQSGKGVGLGLSVVYGIVAQHGGTIELESEPGKGATFILTLPVADELHQREEQDRGRP
ncbi:MAG: PAS domain-containing protein [Desulfomonile sp.]|nr:PAS domain-containing protein [Desulfomonile sp.]